jgi:hypothetical protein
MDPLDMFVSALGVAKYRMSLRDTFWPNRCGQ